MSSADDGTILKPMIEHIQDVQRHLLWIVLFVAIGSGIAFSINSTLIEILQKPLGQNLYYSSPAGNLSFTFKLSSIAGIVFALPVIIYNIFRFLTPALHTDQRRGIFFYAIWSFILAYAGIAFAYFVSLPAALHFLTNFGNANIQSLINVNEYFNFAIAYVAGFALLFQLPLIVLFINRIKPLKPSKMMASQRYIIVGSFILAAILTPTPDPINQAIMAAPIIVLYQFSIVLVLIRNRAKHKPLKAAVSQPGISVRKPVTHARPKPRPMQARRTAYDLTVPVSRPINRQPIQRKPIEQLSPLPRRLLVGNDFF